MGVRSRTGSSLLRVVLSLLALSAARSAWSADTVYLPRGSTWRFHRGVSEASSPDAAAWRQPDFDDSAFDEGPAPFGYGDPPYGTDLGLLVPPMRNGYTTVFLRRDFEVTDPARVGELQANARFDDGFVAWVNGVEVLRINVAGQPGDPVAFDGLAARDREPLRFENAVLPPPAGYLNAGRNVICVQGFNFSRASADFTLDLELVDPFGPDLIPPAARLLVPGPGAVVRRLTQVEATFTEEVTGVDARDLLVNGAPAASAAGSGAGPYTFTFPAPPAGRVEMSWAPQHGIADLAELPNPFTPREGWSYHLDPAAPPPRLALSELLASNNRGLTDEDGETSDWIEIHNRGAVAVNLAGWGLSDDPREPGKWTFPDVTLGPDRFLLVFASGKDRRPGGGGRLHTSFQLNSGGEYLGLYTPESPRQPAFEFAPRFPEQRTDRSYGLDGTGLPGYLAAPTPGAQNGAVQVFEGIVADPGFSPPRGLLAAPVAVEVWTRTPGATIRYTLDGSEPTLQNGELYQTPIPVAGDARKAVVTIRAVAFKDGSLPSNASTSTYIFPDDVLTQPRDPAGFPARWGPAPSVDYEMDPQVVNDPQYRETAREGLRELPAVSIVAPMDDLFGARGLYSNPEADGPAWERPASAELIYPDGREGFQINCGLRLQGGASRLPEKSPKHAFRLHFRADYGARKLAFPVFPGSPVEVFDVLHLRAGFNNSWVHWNNLQRARAQYIHDQWAHDTQRAMGQLSPRGIYVHLYLNGLFWGLYNLVERPDASFAASHLGGEKEDYDALNSAVAVDGDRVAWNTMMGLAAQNVAQEAAYRALAAHLDIPGLIDYMVLNLYGANQDWPHHNWYGIRKREPGAGYRFVSWDAERILEDPGASVIGVANPDSPALPYSRLRLNAEFRLLFADRVQRHLLGGGALTPEAVRARWMARVAEIERSVVLESARWGDYRRDVHPWQDAPFEFYTRNVHWKTEQDRLLRQYFPRRTETLLNQFRGAQLYPRVGAPVPSHPGGVVDPVLLVSLSVPAGTTGTILFTTDGSDPRVRLTGAVSPAAREHAGPLAIEDHTQLKARTLAGGVWSALAETTYVLRPPPGALELSEVMYHPRGDASLEFLEIRNAWSRTMDLSGSRFREGIELTFPGGTILRAGERLVLVADAVTFAERYPGVPVAGVYGGSLENGGERVTLADAAGATLFSVDFDDEGAWPLAPDGLGHSLVPSGTGGDPDDPGSWRASAAPGGSPGYEDPPPIHGGVVVSEVLTRAAAPLEDAVELHNQSGLDVDIGGWLLSDSREDEDSLRKFRIPDGTVIPAGGFAVFYGYQLNSRPGFPGSFDLDAAGGEVFLAGTDARGDFRGYLTGARFGPAENGVPFGRYATSVGPAFGPLAAPTFGVDRPATPAEFREGKGALNAGPRSGSLVLNEVHYHPREGEWEFVEIHNLSGETATLHDPVTGRGFRLEGVLDESGRDAFEFPPGTSVPARGYLLVVPVDPLAFRARHRIPDQVPIAGPYGGALDNGGEALELLRPEALGAEVVLVQVDRVRYNDRAPWPSTPDGGGPSLERIAWEGGGDPASWRASAVAGGSPGAASSVASPHENQPPRASFTVEPPSGPAPLTAAFDASGSTDGDGSVTAYEWSFGDGAQGSGKVAVHPFLHPGTYLALLRVSDDRGGVSSASLLLTVEGRAPPPGGQLPGDVNQDRRLNLTDAITLIGHLFLGWPGFLPCEGGSISDEGNRKLLDLDGQQGVNIGDAIHLLSHLYAGGSPPALGTSCVPIAGCPEACAR